MTCPQKQWDVPPSRCLTCEYCGGLNRGGVLCFKANRKLPYSQQKVIAELFRGRKL